MSKKKTIRREIFMSDRLSEKLDIEESETGIDMYQPQECVSDVDSAYTALMEGYLQEDTFSSSQDENKSSMKVLVWITVPLLISVGIVIMMSVL